MHLYSVTQHGTSHDPNCAGCAVTGEKGAHPHDDEELEQSVKKVTSEYDEGPGLREEAALRSARWMICAGHV